ncbi:MAG: putative zinc-binding metallopeptidase [Gemmatimonadales bacterium]
MPLLRRRGLRLRPHREYRCACGEKLQRFWPFCSECGRAQVWKDEEHVTGAECHSCGWMLSDLSSYCPWCGADVYEEGVSSEDPLKSPKGFTFGAKCDAGCGGGVMYPMPFCPWCGDEQSWDDPQVGSCPHCDRGVDDWMKTCPWCGGDATGQSLIPKTLAKVRRLLAVSGIKHWGYRILLRPGVSGVDPRYPNIVEIERDYVIGQRSRDEIPWSMLVGLVCHELGHSFLFHHWRWTRKPEFLRTFGEADKAYRVTDDTWVDFQRRRISTTYPDHVSAYAATHPQEDFSETFRFYVTRRGRMREILAEIGQKRKAVNVYEKFLALHHYLRQLRGWR